MKSQSIYCKHCQVMLTAILVIAFTSVLSARVIKVDQAGSGDYLTIQEGVNVAKDGDVVLVFPGMYRESVLVKEKKITLMGSGAEATAIYAAGGDAVTFQSAGQNAAIIGFSITGGKAGIYCLGDADPGISNCIISGGTNGVITRGGEGGYPVPSISNCVIVGCGTDGIDIRYGGSISITNSIIIGNGRYAVYVEAVYYGESVSSSYNNFWKNAGGNYGGQTELIVIGTGNMENDPLFVDPSTDLHLQKGSPCIDAGKPGFASLDPDGTRNDMGAYGGPYASMTGILGPIVTELEVTPSIVNQGKQITIRAKGTIR